VKGDGCSESILVITVGSNDLLHFALGLCRTVDANERENWRNQSTLNHLTNSSMLVIMHRRHTHANSHWRQEENQKQGQWVYPELHGSRDLKSQDDAPNRMATPPGPAGARAVFQIGR
jgi:hypothetical protein